MKALLALIVTQGAMSHDGKGNYFVAGVRVDRQTAFQCIAAGYVEWVPGAQSYGATPAGSALLQAATP